MINDHIIILPYYAIYRTFLTLHVRWEMHQFDENDAEPEQVAPEGAPNSPPLGPEPVRTAVNVSVSR